MKNLLIYSVCLAVIMACNNSKKTNELEQTNELNLTNELEQTTLDQKQLQSTINKFNFNHSISKAKPNKLQQNTHMAHNTHNTHTAQQHTT